MEQYNPKQDTSFPELHQTAMRIIHPDSGDASIRQEALNQLEKQIQEKEMCLVQKLSALESLSPSASVPSVVPSGVVFPDNPLDKANTEAPLLKREAIDQINSELLALNPYRSLWQGYTRELDRVTSLGQGLPSFDEALYVHPTYSHHGLNVRLTSPDGHCFLRALNDPGQDKDDPGQDNEIKRTQILLGEDYKEGEDTTPGSFEWVKNTVREYYNKNNFEQLHTLFDVSTDDDQGAYLDGLMKRYFDDKEYASGNIGHFVDTIPTIVFKALANQTNAPQYIIKLRWDGQSGTPHRQFMLYTFNGDEESCRTFEDASSLMAHLNSLTITPKSSVVFNSGIHYEPVII